MTTISIRFANSNNPPVHIQVDPWAGVYTLENGQEIEIVAESDTSSPEFSIQEYGSTRILTLVHSSEYFIMRNGKRVHWAECQADYPV
jgi:hypothetical protein